MGINAQHAQMQLSGNMRLLAQERNLEFATRSECIEIEEVARPICISFHIFPCFTSWGLNLFRFFVSFPLCKLRFFFLLGCFLLRLRPED